MEIWRKRIHEAMGAFLCEIPATAGFSASFGSSFLEIRIHYPVSLAENSSKKPKKKVPPSKVRRNRRRLMKFLDKPEVQPNSPLLSHEKLGDSEGTSAPPFVAHPSPCFGKVLSKEVDLECDTAHITPGFQLFLPLFTGRGVSEKKSRVKKWILMKTTKI